MITLKLLSAKGAPQTGRKSQDWASVSTQGYPTPESCSSSCRGIRNPPTEGERATMAREEEEEDEEEEEEEEERRQA